MRELDEKYMREALLLAEKAYALGESPVGAVVVGEDGRIIGSGYNTVEKDGSVLKHAEVTAIEQAAAFLKDRRLDGCTLYSTLEPCLMCAGVIMLSRIKRIVYGAYADKTGVISSVVSVFDLPLGYRPLTRGGVFENECAALMSRFGKDLRDSGDCSGNC